MCEFSGKLIAWIDRELPAAEAANVERHVRLCAECRGQLHSYERASAAFEAYYDAAIASKVRRRPQRWMLAVTGAAAVAAALFLILPRASFQSSHTATLATAATSPMDVESKHVIAIPTSRSGSAKLSAPLKKDRGRQVVSSAPRQASPHRDVHWLPEPDIQIVIPAEAMFAPGAVPEGVSFTADLTIATDGSAQRIRLLP